MVNYTFILKHLKPFFFGGEKSTFDKAEYFLQSRYFPQQTSALGLVREYILDVANLLGKTKSHESDCNKYIGSGSFNGQFNQGAIMCLSPIQVVETINTNNTIEITDVLFLSKFDLSKINLLKINARVDFGFTHANEIDLIGLVAGRKQKIYDSKDKDFIDNRFISINNTNNIPLSAFYDEDLLAKLGFKKIKEPGVFIENVKSGNTKNYNGNSKDNKDCFYKQISYELNKGYSFAFEVSIDENIFPKDLSVKNKTIRFGGRASMFSMTIIKDKEIQQLSSNRNGNSLLLLSDALVDNSVYENITSCITDTLTLRYATTTNAEADYNKRLNREYDKSRQFGSERKTLLSRGSILISNNVKETLEYFNNEIDFLKLGYNKTIQL